MTAVRNHQPAVVQRHDVRYDAQKKTETVCDQRLAAYKNASKNISGDIKRELCRQNTVATNENKRNEKPRPFFPKQIFRP